MEAARAGAVASLTRSITPYSLYTPHTGVMYYEEGVKQIPAAAITVEDAILLSSLQSMNLSPVLSFFMNPQTLPLSLSRNGFFFLFFNFLFFNCFVFILFFFFFFFFLLFLFIFLYFIYLFLFVNFICLFQSNNIFNFIYFLFYFNNYFLFISFIF